MRTLPLRSQISRTRSSIARVAAALIGAVTLLSAPPADAKGRHGGDDRDDDRWERNERHHRHGHHGHHDRHASAHRGEYRYGSPRPPQWRAPLPFLPPLPPPPWQWGRWQPGYHAHAPGCGHAGYGYARPVYYGHGYWCERCNHGWRARDDFYSHVYHHHHVPYPRIPGVVVNVGATWVFGY